jgi:hypothetical protein
MLIAMIVSLSALRAQQSSTPPKIEPRSAGPEKVQPIATERQIVLDVQVTDHSGQPVRGLNTSFRRVADERDAIRSFLLQNDGQLVQAVSLVVFAGSGTKIQNRVSHDGKALAALYDQYETGLRANTGSQGFYGATEHFPHRLPA